MDRYAASLANILVGNPMNDAVVEMHFPTSHIHFEIKTIIAITGANFYTTNNDLPIPNDRPIWVAENTVLHFQQPVSGARCYLAVWGGFKLSNWLDSNSTHLKAGAGGFNGRKLMHDDSLLFNHSCPYMPEDAGKHFDVLPFLMKPVDEPQADAPILTLPGNEWEWLTAESKKLLLSETFTISLHSDRMGYRLSGPGLQLSKHEELISSPVTFGTIQLLPDGNLIVLMADHQTTGGYPRIGHVISAHHSRLAQKKPGDQIRFQFTDIRSAESLLLEQQQHLMLLQNEWSTQMNTIFEKHN
jgi:antagonist of KipI